MASIIKLKRSSTQSAVPGSLNTGEIAVNLFDRKLFVGNGAGVTAIGGEDFRFTTDGSPQEGVYLKLLGDSTLSTNNVLIRGGTGITVGSDANGSVSITSTGTVADGGVTTAKIADGAVTAAKIASNGLTANTYGAKSIDTAAIADAAITSAKLAAGGVTANAIGNDSVALGTKTTGNYVATVSGSGGVSVSGSGSETATVSVSLDDNISSNTSGTAATATALGTARNFSISGDVTASAQSFDGTGNVTLNTSLAAGVVDTAELADAAVTGAKLASKTVAANAIVDGTITSAQISAGGITANAIGNDSVALGTKTTGNYIQTVTGTANEIEVSGSGSESADITIGLPNDVTVGAQLNVGENLVVTGNTSVGGDLQVDGDLTVTGATTYLSTSTVYTDDGMFKLSANNSGDLTDTGIYAKYVVSGNSAVQYTGYFRDATDGAFKFYTGLDVEPTSTVNVSDTGYTLAQLDAVIDGGTY